MGKGAKLLGEGGGGVLLGILGGVLSPGSPNPDPINFRPKNVIFHTCFQTWPLRNYVFIT